ncbi:MAG: hypothetical protein CMG44_01275 [Candidatus Marinimicrobia bacterium]|nr:hypothetical protein [Candidatus Neomarinimicrobiota bacterium]|tara:strand:- start:384 stop:875 length:492 start_codon:yes stop_codon:yes gene_type:complete
MNSVQIIFISLVVLLFQFLLVDFLSLNLIRPDFLVIYILFIGLSKGKFVGTMTGFCLGLISNLFGIGSLFGLESLSLSIVGYLAGYLTNSYEKLLPYIFHSIWLIIIFIHFFIICYFRFQNIYLLDLSDFLFNWLASVSYTLLFIIAIQFIYPLKDASHAEVS